MTVAAVEITLDDATNKVLLDHLQSKSGTDLVEAYLFWLEKSLGIEAVLYPPEKKIYRNVDELIARLEKAGRLWRETSIKVGRYKEDVNEETKRIYICPFTGKVFGDNTHPNPQDAIYDWVSKTPENTERVGGLRAKRFFVSEDPKVIEEYIAKSEHRRPVTKTVFSSVSSGKLFSSREDVVKDFRAHSIKPLSLLEVQSQDRFEIEQSLIDSMQDYLQEEHIREFVEALAELEDFVPYVEQWIEPDEDTDEDGGDKEE